jgi:hypothetical protein
MKTVNEPSPSEDGAIREEPQLGACMEQEIM